MRALGFENGGFDIVVIRYLWCAAKFGIHRLGRVFIDVDDAPEDQFATHVAPYINKWLRPFAKWCYLSWQYILAKSAAGIWVSNPADLAALSKHNANARLLPNVAPSYAIALEEGREKPYLLSVGHMSWRPNYAGMDRFIEREWPGIKKRFQHLAFKIAGRGAPEECRRKWQNAEGVEMLGFVDDLAGLYASALAVVVPLWAGAGTSIKTIEAVKAGCKVFSTPCGARGFDAAQLAGAGISVVGEDGAFAGALAPWLAKSPAERLCERRGILAFSAGLSTMDEFRRQVRGLIENAPPARH